MLQEAVCYFMAIHELKLELSSRNTQIGTINCFDLCELDL